MEYAGNTSELYYTRSGVSQGSNLGLLQFLIMINDLPGVVRNAECLLFADDLKLLLAVRDRKDCIKFQQDIDRVVQWNRQNKLEFNISKCSIMSFGRMKSMLNFNYKIEGKLMTRVQTVRDLGVKMKTDLSFSDHIKSVCKKAYRNLGFVMRNANDFTNIKALISLYNALVRSHLECNAMVWAPHEVKYSSMLEKIQNKFTRFLYLKYYGVYPFYPLMYPTLFVLGMVGYNKLEVRRGVALVKYVWKVLRGTISNAQILSNLYLLVPDAFVERRRRPRLLTVPRARTQLLSKAPLTRALSTLNDIADITDIFLCSMSEFEKVALYVLCYNNM